MTDNQSENLVARVWKAGAAVIALLVAAAFIPPIEVCGTMLRRANILSALMTFDDTSLISDVDETASEATAEELEAVDMERITAEIAADTIPAAEEILSFEWVIDVPAERQAREPADDAEPLTAGITAVEDFGGDDSPFARFLDKLEAGNEPVRIAVAGDSFIEGDIMTCDLRLLLQQRFGTESDATGFAPASSPLTAFRRTVKTRSSGWSSYNVMQQQSTPAAAADKYMLGGWVSLPAAGASTRWEPAAYGTGVAPRASHVDIYLLSPSHSRTEVIINDTLRRPFEIAGSPKLRRISVTAPAIASAELRVISPGEGFIGYGASFRGDGVTVDNYSVRSNSGQALLRMNHSLNAQLDRFTPYDLVILQYGLNIMQQGRHNYDSYTVQVEKMTELVRGCFPAAAVLIMGVSDRSVKSDDGSFVRIDALPYLDEAQREAARRTGSAFWSTSAAMQTEGGMARFVAEGCAGKDYTHINYRGGERIARALCQAICAAAEARPRAIERREAMKFRAEELFERDDIGLKAEL